MADTETKTSHNSAEPGRGDYVEVGYEPLDSQRAVELVTHPSAGAISTFVGTTRDNFQGKKVVRLEYEGYTPMAVSELRKICVTIREKWPDVVGVALFHRLGVVEVAEASVIVAVSSPHRREALEACAFAIDTLKATVPIWKSEQYEGDARMWKENVEWRDGAVARSSCCSTVKGRIQGNMGAVGDIEPRRLALRYEPPGIIVEYIYHSAAARQLYHHEIDLKTELSSSEARFSEYHIDEVVNSIIRQHADVVGNSKVPSAQLVRLVRKLVEHRTAVQAPILPQADYNRVSETQLKQVKQKMDLVFEQNIIRPDQQGYQYDKQVEFQPGTETSDWDD